MKALGYTLSLFFALCGCSHLATVKVTSPHLPAPTADDQLNSARQDLIASSHKPAVSALAYDLSAARTSFELLRSRPNDSSAQNIYNFAVARVVDDVERANLQPWQHATTIVGQPDSYVLTSPKPVDPEHNPDRYDLFPTNSLQISGRFFKTRPPVSGIGAPLVAVGRAETPQFHEKYKLQRIYAPVTSVVRFSGREAQLDFVDPLKSTRVNLSGHNFPLATDLSASTAMLLARERPERMGFSGVIHPQAYAAKARLCQLQQFDANRTPVVFVHGLQETPASWSPMIDTLRDDPWIREHYQFWVFTYPSGYPYPYSAMLLRHDLDGIARTYPSHKPLVLVGHSMGGMISRLMITDSGDKIWREFFGTTPDKTPLSGETKRLIEDVFIFEHRREVNRVVFISTPHRGSKMAAGWIGRIGAALVRTPRHFASIYASTKPILTADPAARPLNRMPNSVDTLEPNDRFVRAVNKLPITPGIPYDSIMGDRGRGDTPNSSDGIVPYWSSHLAGAKSELIVNSDHSAQYNPQAIREVARILRLNLARSDD